MFRENTDIRQGRLFGFTDILSAKQREKISQSKEHYFFNYIVCQINEKDFKPLFEDNYSRPNAPVNLLVGSLILKELNDWTFKELMDEIEFDLLTKVALGLTDIQEQPFCYATLFNFKKRIAQYTINNNIDLFEKNFKSLTQEQIKRLQLKTDVQRADTAMINLNIRNYSRLEILIEILIRLHKDLLARDKQKLSDILSPYTKQTAQNQVYELRSSDIPKEIEKLAQVYLSLKNSLQATDYPNTKSYHNFIRVFNEHFFLIENSVTVIADKDLTSSILQSPDAPDATYRYKSGEKNKGLVVFASETCHPENPIDLITDVSVYQNNTDDTEILYERAEILKEQTPDLSQLHTDGGFGNASNDSLLEELSITHIATAIRGRQTDVEIRIEKENNSDIHIVSCPYQTIESQPTKKNNKACFDSAKCTQCPLIEVCRIPMNKGKYYFSNEAYQTNKRKNAIRKLPVEYRKLRPNVEATMKEFKKGVRNGKLRVRETLSVVCYAANRAIAINFGRIFRYSVLLLAGRLFCFLQKYFIHPSKYHFNKKKRYLSIYFK